MCTLGSITLHDKKIKSNNYQLLYVLRLINILVYFCCDILTGLIDTVPCKSDVTFLFEYITWTGFGVCSVSQVSLSLISLVVSPRIPMLTT